MRVLGRLWGSIVFILDIAKVFIAFGIVYFIGNIFKQDTGVLLRQIFIVAAVVGHCYPIYYGFKGGKGVAVALTALFILNSQIFLVCAIAGLLIILVTRMVSMGSIGGVILFIIMTFVMIPQYVISAVIIAFIILFKHRSNIRRILEGQENKAF
ncbi:putative glycerol-3-phosphate acyltransferase [compost metagenome]